MNMNDSSHATQGDIVNGINADDVRTLIDEIETDAGRGMTHWRVSSRWQGGTRSQSRIDSFDIGGTTVPRSFSIDIDEPAELGGTNTYANPQEYLLAALNACMTVGYAAVCALHGISIRKLEIVTEGDIDLRGFLGISKDVARGYESLKSRVTIKADATEEQLREIHATVMASSPNFHNITTAVRVEPMLVIE
ncbi:OsmC family protein [Paraburkholderia sp. 2C]